MNLWNLPNREKDELEFFLEKGLLPRHCECKNGYKKNYTSANKTFFGNATSRCVSIKPICVQAIG